MGEAKRRQKRDPGFGKTDVRISIRESSHTNNYLVMVNEVIADSTIHYSEAVAIQKWLEEELTLNPLKKYQLTGTGIYKWIVSSHRLKDYPESTAEIITIDTQTGQRGTAKVTITGDNIVKHISP